MVIKVKKVIESCETIEQMISAYNYLELSYKYLSAKEFIRLSLLYSYKLGYLNHKIKLET